MMQGRRMTREQKKQQRHDAIVTHGLQLIRTHGFDEVSVKQITDAAGLAKGTFFNYFASKGDLIAHWYDAIVEKAIAENAKQPLSSDLDTILDIGLYCINATRAEPELWNAKRQLVATNVALQTAESRMDEKLREFFSELFKDRVCALSAREIADLVVCVLTGTVQECATYGASNDIEKLVQARLKNLLTLIPPKPLA